MGIVRGNSRKIWPGAKLATLSLVPIGSHAWLSGQHAEEKLNFPSNIVHAVDGCGDFLLEDLPIPFSQAVNRNLDGALTHPHVLGDITIGVSSRFSCQEYLHCREMCAAAGSLPILAKAAEDTVQQRKRPVPLEYDLRRLIVA